MLSTRFVRVFFFARMILDFVHILILFNILIFNVFV